MLDRQLIRSQPDLVRAGAARKGIVAPVDAFLAVDARWRALRTELEGLQAELNRQSKSIGQLMGQGKRDEAEAAKAATKELKARIDGLESDADAAETELRALETEFPNLPCADVPDGKDADDNVVVRSWGEPPAGEFRPHWDIADELGLLDLPRGAKIAGSGFVVYTGWGARLQRALFNFMVDWQTQRNGYREIYPPVVVNRASLTGTGQLPKFEDDLYRIDDELFLIPTAEVPVTNLYRDEILDADQLPMRFAAVSGCFRREAGAAGKDTRGLQRLHQFDKVEMVWYARPEESYAALEEMTGHAESVLQALGLAYRVVLLCGGDMSFSNAKCYDLEVWSPGLGKHLEISSCSNFEAFQARRANIRYRPAAGERPEFVHTLNGSGLATPRLFAALVETYYEPGVGVRLPEPLRPYVGADVLPIG